MHAKVNQFIDQAFAQFECAAHDPLIFRFQLAETSIELRSATSALQHLLSAAIAHHPSAQAPADLTIYAWSGRDVAPPPPPWPQSAYGQRSSIAGLEDLPIYATFYVEYGLFSLIDLTRQIALFWVRDLDRFPDFARSAPLREILHWFLRPRQIHTLHAGAVGSTDGCALLVGRGGSGKSTSTLACVGSHLGFLGDDYCLTRSDGTPQILSLYCSSRLNPDSLRWLPHLHTLVAPQIQADEPKSCLYLHPQHRAELVAQAPLKAIVLPRVGDGPLRLEAIGAGQALRALAPSTMFQLSATDAATFQTMSRLVQAVPCYILHLDPNLAAIPCIIGDLLREQDQHWKPHR